MKKCFHFIDKVVKDNFCGFYVNRRKVLPLFLLGIMTGILIFSVGCGPTRRQYAINEALLIDQTRILEDEIYRTRSELERCLQENRQLQAKLTKEESNGTASNKVVDPNQNQELLPITTSSRNVRNYQTMRENLPSETIPSQVIKTRSAKQQSGINASPNSKNVPQQSIQMNSGQAPANVQPNAVQPNAVQPSVQKTPGGSVNNGSPTSAAPGTLPQIRQPNLLQPSTQKTSSNVYNPVWQQNENYVRQEINQTSYDLQVPEENELKWSPLEN